MDKAMGSSVLKAVCLLLGMILLSGALPAVVAAADNAWTGSGPFATGLANRQIFALAVSDDGATVYAGTGSGTVFAYSAAKPTATTEAATNQTWTSATLNATVNAKNATTTVSFEYGATTAYGASIAATPATATGTADTAVTADLAGLAAGSTIHYRVRAENSSGVAYGGDMSFATGATSTTFTYGAPSSVTIGVGGTPVPALSETGALPAGITFADNGDGTATLSGTPNTAGTFVLVIIADYGGGSTISQSYVLTVNAAPTITSAASAAFTYGTASSFTVTAGGTPVPTLSETGALPAGITFADNGDGTATLSGTPNAAGTFAFTITAANGVGNAASQSFALTVTPQNPSSLSAADPDISVSPDRHLFGVESIGDCSASTAVPFTVTNIGSNDLSLGTLGFGGMDSTEFTLDGDTCSGTTLAPGDACTVQVKFCPTSTGSKAATLQIPSSAPDTPVLNALLYNDESTGEAAARRMPPVLAALSIPEVITGGQTYTITWSLLGYDSAYLSRVAFFDCTGAAAGTCGSNPADSFADSGDLSAVSSEAGTWSYNGVASKKFTYSYTFSAPGVLAATPIVIRFYQKSRSDDDAGLDSLSLLVPGNIVPAGTGYYDAQGRRLSHTITP